MISFPQASSDGPQAQHLEVASYWLNRFDSEKHTAEAELIDLILVRKLVVLRLFSWFEGLI